MPIEKCHKPHDVAHKRLDDGITYNELHSHNDGEGLTSGITAVQGESGIAIENPYGTVGVVMEGVLVFVDSGAPNDHHTLKEGQTFHIKKGSTFKFGAGSDGKAFYASGKPLSTDFPQSFKKPAF